MAPPSGADDPVTWEYDWATTSPCFAVIDAIARYEGNDTPQMAKALPNLQDTLDTDALDTLCRTSSPLTLSFRYADYHVHLTDDTVAISHPPAST